MNKIIKSPYFWVLLFIVGIGILAFVVASSHASKLGILLISNVNSLECDKSLSCEKVTSEQIMKDKTTLLLDTYEGNQYLGEYKVDYINKWNFYDSNNQWINLQNSFLAGSKEMHLQVKEYNTRKMTSEEQLEFDKLLQQNKVDSYSQLVQNEVVEYDLNHDGIVEKLILASNVTEDSNDEQLFAVVIGVIKNKYEVLHIDIYGQYENYEVPIYNVKTIVNLFDKKEDIIILLKGYFSEAGTPESFLYKLEDKKFKLLTE